VRHSKKRWKGRARGASDQGEFERALRGKALRDGNAFDPARDRKTLQLCRQVQRALMLALGGECGEEALGDVWVESVEPMGSASQLMVRIVAPPAGAAAVEVSARLNARAGALRAAIAGAICRKRVPMLTFLVVPEPRRAAEGGDHG